MSLKKYYFDKNIECCYTCMYIDEYAFNVEDKGQIPHGYDGTALCCKFDDKEPETINNRCFISPCWKACHKYKRCTERQSNYLDVFSEEEQKTIENPNDISKIKQY